MDSRSSSSTVDDDDDDDHDDDDDSALFPCPVCCKSCSSDNARWQHVNLEHISRRIFPSAAFLKENGRDLCSKCGFAYSSRWKSCRRSQGAGNCRCGGIMVDPVGSVWLSKMESSDIRDIRVIDHVEIPKRSEPLADLIAPLNGVKNAVQDFSCRVSTSYISRAAEACDDDQMDCILVGLRSAESLLCHVANESAAFDAFMNEIMLLPVTTVCHTPRSIRPLLAQVLASEFSHACRDGLWGFARLYLFPKLVLRFPPRGGKKKRYAITALLRSRLQRWQAGDLLSLWQDAQSECQPLTPRSTDTASLSRDNARRAVRFAREGRFSIAMQSLGSAGCAPYDDSSALEELQERHPDHPLPVWNDAIPPSLTVTVSSVLSALHAFPRASSPGSSKLRCQHLLDAIEGSTAPSAGDCLQNLTQYVCFLLSGQADVRIAPWLTGAPLTALYKRQGGIRPIAVGEVIRRLVSRICCLAVRPYLQDVFVPSGQVGVGVPGGMEAAVHSLRSFVDSHGDDPSLCCLKVDFTNAFNECHRSSFLLRLHSSFPEIFGWILWSYRCAGELRFGNFPLHSKAGVQQGDPLGPLLFSLVILQLLDDIGNLPGLLLKLWHLDDGTFVGERKSIALLLEKLSSLGPRHGLHINKAKCEVFWPSGDPTFPEFPADVHRVVASTGGAQLLGSPIFGSQEYYNNCVGKKVDIVLSCQEHLSDLKDPQVELHLLRSCLSLCKVNHLLRTVPSNRAMDQFRRFDSGLRSCLETITNSSLSDAAWIQASLPIRLGGLGLREASKVATAAFTGSCNSSRSLSTHLLDSDALSVTKRALTESSIREQLSSSLPPNHTLNLLTSKQREIQSVLDLTRHNDLKRSASLRDLARINALSAPHTGSWLLAIPNFNLGLAMTPQEFVIALRIRLGLSLFPFPPAFTRCFCGHAIDPFADHVPSCGTGPLRSKRHDALCDVLHHTLLIDNSSCRREQRCLSDDNSRPGDLYHPDFHLGRPAYFDITVRNSLLPQFLINSSLQAGAAAASGELKKDSKYLEAVESAHCLFYPLVIETLGTWSPSSLETLKTIARRTTLSTGSSTSNAVRHLHQQLSVRLWQFNARMVLERLLLYKKDTSFWEFV